MAMYLGQLAILSPTSQTLVEFHCVCSSIYEFIVPMEPGSPHQAHTSQSRIHP